MGYPRSATTGLRAVLLMTTMGLGACNTPTTTGSLGGVGGPAKPMAVSDQERDCLGRAMYFESNRSDSEGLLAVGTVVMNRLEAAAFPNGGICAVVGQPRQFATGVLTKPMAEKDLTKVADAADAILAGQRHPKVGRAMYFHTAGRKFHYDNMHYVAVAGGNAFYEKRKAGAAAQAAPPTALAFAAAPMVPAPEASPAVVAAVAATPAAVEAQTQAQAQSPAEASPTATAQGMAPPVHARAAQKPAAKTRVAQGHVSPAPAAMAPDAPPPPPVINLPRP